MTAPAVLLLDDGELDDVQEILEEMGAQFARVRGSAIAPGTPAPQLLLISTANRAHVVSTEASGEGGPKRVVVMDVDSPSQRDKLRTSGFDFLVRRPVHPEALRLLLMHCLYRGEERRSENRVPIGLEITFRSGLLPRRATLADLSLSGSRLLSRYALRSGKRIKLDLTEVLGAEERVTVRGRVIRTNFDESLGSQGLYRTAVAFQKLEPGVRESLEWALEDRAKGPPRLSSEDHAIREDSPSVKTTPVLAEHVKTRPDDPRVEPQLAEGAPSAAPGDGEAVDAAGSREDAEATFDREVRDDRRTDRDRRAGEDRRDRLDRRADDDAKSDDRRTDRRAVYDRKVPAFGDKALSVLMGRDLSLSGMRVQEMDDVKIGDRMHLAVYGDAKEPLLIWATAKRDDRDDGLLLAFDPLPPETARQLEKIVGRLPAVEALESAGTVVGRIIDR
jgi:hypothetical protein